jgi:hypothetical protein
VSGIPWPQIGLVLGALIAVVGVIYTARSSRRSAERTTDVEQIGKMWDRLDKMQKEIDELRAMNLAQDRMIHAHMPWDDLVTEELRKKGIRVIDAPPLTV